MKTGTLVVTGNSDADYLLNSNFLALLIGMLLDQQIPIEWAFIAPYRLAQRLDGTLDAAKISAIDPEDLVTLASEKPAIHRFPAMMARRIHKLCEHLVTEYDGQPASLWTELDNPDMVNAEVAEVVEVAEIDSAEIVYQRLLALPGFGPVKAKIFMSILAKRFSYQPNGWEQIAGEFASEDLRSVADLGDPGALSRLRQKRRAAKEKTAQEAVSANPSEP